MRGHPRRRTQALILGVLGPVLAACAAPPDGGAAAPGGAASPLAASPPVEAPASPAVTVPSLVGQDATVVTKLAAAAGVVPILEHRAGAAAPAGTVVRVDPAGGTAVALGSTIVVTIAGPAGGTLDDLIAADRRNFVGLGADPDGTLVVAISDERGADEAWRRIEPAAGGRKHRVVRCATSWSELDRITVEVTRRPDLAALAGYAVAVDPAACAVKVEGEIPPAVGAALRSAYASKVVVDNSGPARRAGRD